jgi:hypothetical protein
MLTVSKTPNLGIPRKAIALLYHAAMALKEQASAFATFTHSKNILILSLSVMRRESNLASLRPIIRANGGRIVSIAFPAGSRSQLDQINL